MTYKRYIKKNGKVFGPYYYRNTRTKDGRVKSVYVGQVGVHDSSGKKLHYSYKAAIAIVALILVFTIIGFPNFELNNGAVKTEKIIMPDVHEYADQEITVSDKSGSVVANSDVRIEKKITLRKGDAEIMLPTQSSGISVSKLVGSNYEKIDPRDVLVKIGGKDNTLNNVNGITGNVVKNPVTDFLGDVGFGFDYEDSETSVMLDSENEYLISYVIPAPRISEKIIDQYRKQISLVSEQVFGNVLTFSRISESPKDSIRLFMYDGGVKKDVTKDLRYTDTNNNGLIDYVEWNSPSTENVYEIFLEILNIQSYPYVRGNWTVRIVTSGTEDLQISAINGTTYALDDGNTTNDLRFLELRCGNEKKDPEMVFDEYTGYLKSVLMKEYSCNETSFYTVKVLTLGKHTQQIKFGNQVKHAFNLAGTPVVDLLTPANRSVDEDGNVIFSCSATDSLDIVNMSLWHDVGGIWKMNYTRSPHETYINDSNGMIFGLHFNDDISEEGEPPLVGSVFQQDGKFMESGYFDNDGKLDFDQANNFNKAEGTLSVWIRPNFTIADGSNHVIFYSGDEAGYFWLGKWADDNIYWKISGTENTSVYVNASDHLAVGQWTHIAVTWKEGCTSCQAIYINGELLGNGTGESNTDFADSVIKIGNDDELNGAVGGWVGDLDEFLVFDHQLSGEVIGELYDRAKPIESYQINHAVNSVPNGTYTWNCEAWNNESVSASGINNFTLFVGMDATQPYVTAVSDTPDPVQAGGIININATVTDDRAVDTVLIEINGTVNLTTEKTGDVYHSTSADTSVAGTYTYKIIANDTSGNINDTEIGAYEVTSAADVIPPSVEIISSIPDPVQVYNFINISVAVTDNAAVGDVIIEITQPDGTRTNYTTNNMSSIYYNDVINATAIGSNIYRIYSNDASDNRNDTESDTFTVQDSSGPSVSIQSPENTTINNVSVELNFTATDNFAVDHCWYSIDSGLTSVSLEGCANITLDMAGGGNTITVYANDTSNNIGSTSVSFVIDITPLSVIEKVNASTFKELGITEDLGALPVVTLSIPENGNVSAVGDITFFCNASDTNGLINISFYNDVSGSFSLNQTVDVREYPLGDATRVLWFHMNNDIGRGEGSGNFFYDYSNYHNNGTCSGDACPAWTSGKFSGGSSFDGINDYVNVNDAVSLDMAGNLTIEMWVNLTSYPAKSSVSKRSVKVLTKSAVNQSIKNISVVTNDVTFCGVTASDQSGVSAGSGDFNNDGVDDMIIGANTAEGACGTTNNNGEIYIVYGPSLSSSQNISLRLSTANVTFCGIGVSDGAGTGVGSGDFNNDGIADVVIGANAAEGAGGSPTDAGETYIIYGPTNLSGNFSLSTANITFFGMDNSDRSGQAVASGDFNNDGIDDLVVTAFLAEGAGGSTNSAGEVYILYGPLNTPGTFNLSVANVTFYGKNSSDRLGQAADSGDFNNDGIDDLAMGAYLASGPNGKPYQSGEAYIFYGPLSTSGTFNASTANITFNSSIVSDRLGSGVGSGDFNNDGIDDLVVGAYMAEGSGGPNNNEGENYIIYGPLNMQGTFDVSKVFNITFYGTAANDFVGYGDGSVDFNNDGIDDLFLSAWSAEGACGTTNGEGETYVMYGPIQSNSNYDLMINKKGKPVFSYVDTTNKVTALQGANLTLNQYTFIAATVDTDRNEVALYINNTKINKSSTRRLATITSPLTIGSNNAGTGGWLNGTMDEIAVYSRALPAEELQDHYNTTKTFYAANFTLNSTPNGNYIWNCKAYSTINSFSFAPANFSFIVGAVQAVAITVSDNLSTIAWNISVLPSVNASALGNNGTNPTFYIVSVSVSGTNADIYIKALANLTKGATTTIIPLDNERIAYNTSDSTVPVNFLSSMTTSYADNKIGSGVADSTKIYLKFFLNVSGAQPAGIYNNTVSIKAVPAGTEP